MSDDHKFYYVIEHATGIVRAAQSTLDGAFKYTAPDGDPTRCHERFIVGPLTVAELHKGGWARPTPARIEL